MLKVEKIEVEGFNAAIRGMRNPKNSWDLSDSKFIYGDIVIGKIDQDLANRLAKGGPVHGKYKRMIQVYMDITGPLYWWKEMDTYKIGTVTDSCSTMHKLADKEFELDDFSHDHLMILPEDGTRSDDILVTEGGQDIPGERVDGLNLLMLTINVLNYYRKRYIATNDKRYWWQMIQLLPSSYNQKRTVMFNYEVATNIFYSRKGHKLDEWNILRDVIKDLPYAEEMILVKQEYL